MEGKKMDALCMNLAVGLALEDTTDADRVSRFIESVEDARIQLLRNKEVVRWLLGDITFLEGGVGEEKKTKAAAQKRMKEREDAWGQAVTKARRPDLALDGQWTTRFGEHICEELAILCGKTHGKPEKKEHFQPDLDVGDALWEVKTQTFFTTGTAGEKILGCPFKYADLPVLYGKPLRIVCLGGAENVCRESYGNLPGEKCSLQKQKFLRFFAECDIEYIAASEILLEIGN